VVPDADKPLGSSVWARRGGTRRRSRARQRRRRHQSKTTATRVKMEGNLCLSNAQARHNQHLGVLDQARARAQAKPGCDSLGRHAQVPSKPSYRCCATATMATNSRGAVVRLIGGERFGTCAHVHASVVTELVHAHTFVHAHDAEAFGGNTARRSAAELVSGRGPACTCWGARRRHSRRIPAEDSSTKA
jgi:hypothetical protein